MAVPKKSMDREVLDLIEILERKGFLKLSPRRFTPDPPTKRYRSADLLRTKAAAAYLKISQKTLANWRVAGSGPRFIKAGGTVSYRVAELKSFVDSRVRTSTSDRGAE